MRTLEKILFSQALCKKMAGLKKILPIESVRALYKGIGSHSYRVQYFVRFNNQTVADVWLEGDYFRVVPGMEKDSVQSGTFPFPTDENGNPSLDLTFQAIATALSTRP